VCVCVCVCVCVVEPQVSLLVSFEVSSQPQQLLR